MASKSVKQVNKGYAARYTRKSSKGLGVYALSLPGTSPNGVHVQVRPGDPLCRCGGCSGRR